MNANGFVSANTASATARAPTHFNVSRHSRKGSKIHFLTTENTEITEKPFVISVVSVISVVKIAGTNADTANGIANNTAENLLPTASPMPIPANSRSSRFPVCACRTASHTVSNANAVNAVSNVAKCDS